MKRPSTIFLQSFLVLIGVGTLTFLLWEPHVEGRNQHATLFEVYFNDPFLAYVYVGSVPFFVGLYQAFKLLGYAERNTIFSPAAVAAMRTIKHCAIAIVGFVAVSVVFFWSGDPEDRPPGVVMRILVILPSIVVATAAALFERILQNAVEIKSENDLTV
jgi:hypothetical protein